MATLAQTAYRRLRDDILRGHFAPGQKLGLEQLKARYGLSFSPLREAMNRLQAERLLVPAAARGFAVAPVSPAELWDTTEVRILVETEALRRSILRGDAAWEDALVTSFGRLEMQDRRLNARGPGATEDDLAALEERHRDFHAALIGACGSPRLMALFAQFHAETQRYRLPTLAARAGRSDRDVAGEHRALMDASLSRDAARAAELLAAHYRLTARQLDPGAVAGAPPATDDLRSGV